MPQVQMEQQALEEDMVREAEYRLRDRDMKRKSKDPPLHP